MKKRMVSIALGLAVVLAALTVSQVVRASYPTPPSLESEVFVQGGNGFGSTGIYARRFSNIFVNVGSDITYTDDATYGAYFTINTDGLYAMTVTDWSNLHGDGFGIAVNASPSAYIQTDATQLCSISSWPNQVSSCSATAYLNSGDVVRAIWGGVGPFSGGAAQARFVIVKVK